MLSLTCVLFFNRCREYKRADQSDDACHNKRHFRSNTPKQSTNKRSGSDRQTTYQVIETNRASAHIVLCEIDNHCFTCRLADFTKTANHECENDRSEEYTSELQSQSNLVCRLLL